MLSGPISFLLLVTFLLPVQTPRDSIQLHYQKAEALRRAGNPAGAETEYTAILSEAYLQLGKVRLAQAQYPAAVETLEAATASGADSDQTLIDLSIAYFYTERYQQALKPLQQVIARNANSASAYHMLGKT